MWKSLEVWPTLRTLRLMIVTLHLWFLGAGLLFAYAVLFITIQVTANKSLPELTHEGVVQGLGIVFGVAIALMFRRSLIYAHCEQLVKPLLTHVADPDLKRKLELAESSRLKGSCKLWKQTMDAVAAGAIDPGAQNCPRAQDAAQRLCPATCTALLLFLTLLSGPFWWTPLTASVHLPGWQFLLAMICSWLLAGLVTGCIASAGIGLWLHAR